MGVINEKTVRKSIQIINAAVDFAVLIAILLLTAFSGYALWDSNRLYTSAAPKKYAIYKPTEENDTKTAAPGGKQRSNLGFIIPVSAILILALIFALYYRNLKNNSKGV